VLQSAQGHGPAHNRERAAHHHGLFDPVGIEHVALGSDWDGSKAVITASGLALLTEGLMEAGFSQEEIAAILGGNVLRVLRATLP